MSSNPSLLVPTENHLGQDDESHASIIFSPSPDNHSLHKKCVSTSEIRGETLPFTATKTFENSYF